MPENTAPLNEPSRLLDLVSAYTSPRRDDDLAVGAPASPDEPAARESSRQPAKSRRRHGSSKARRRTRHSPAARAA